MEMKTIKNITVRVTYEVSLSNVEVSEEVFNYINNVYDFSGQIDDLNPAHSRATDWIADNIREFDACEWTTEIRNLD